MPGGGVLLSVFCVVVFYKQFVHFDRPLWKFDTGQIQTHKAEEATSYARELCDVLRIQFAK